MNTEFNPFTENEQPTVPSEQAGTPMTAEKNASAETDASKQAETPSSAEADMPPQAAPSEKTVPPMTNTTQNPTYFSGYNPYTGIPYGQPIPQKKKKRGAVFFKQLASVVALALVFGVISGAIILGVTGGMNNDPQTNASDSDDRLSESGNKEDADPSDGNQTIHSGELQSAAAAMQEALEKANLSAEDNLTIPQINIIMEPTMVSINCYSETILQTPFGQQTYPTSSSGSGIIVGENETELLIVTNNHVIDNADDISVQFNNGQEASALIKGTDAANDLAIIVVKLADIPDETMNVIAYAELGDSDALVIGEGVVAIGNALGFGQSVTAGIVSALDRAVTDSNNNTTYLIQTDAAINPGNSGGALVNMKGQVIGINSAKYSDEAVEGMGFAIPINTAIPILEDLMSRTTRVEIEDPEKRGYLGITPQDVSSTIAAMYNMPVGVFVSSVEEGSAAEKAGILAGDIITKFDHENVTTRSALSKIIGCYEVGETVDLVVQRYEQGRYVEMTITVTLGARPTASQS